jgi:hypothetical protein
MPLQNPAGERARLGQYVGELPVSETKLAVEHRRREALRRDAELIRQTPRPVSSARAPQAVNRLAAWAWGERTARLQTS